MDKDKGNKTVLWHELTRGSLEEWLDRNPDPVVFLPFGSVEQHGPHLPLGTDTFCASIVCEEAARKTGSLVVLPCWPGCSDHHLGFKGTISFKPETLTAVLKDTVESLSRHGVKKILLVNAHGGNEEVLTYAARFKGAREAGCVIIKPNWRNEGVDDESREALEKMDFHAGAGETGWMLCLKEDLVEMERTEGWSSKFTLDDLSERLRSDPPADSEGLEIASAIIWGSIGDTHEVSSTGVYGFQDPRKADRELAKRHIEAGVNYLVRFVQMWRGDT